MKNQGDQSIEGALIQTLLNSEVENVIKELGELALDNGTNNFVENELVEKIPILNIFVAGVKTVLSFRDYVWLKKITKFLYEQNKVSKSERETWSKKFNEDKNKFRIGEAVLESIDKVNSLEKARIIGVLFRAYIQNKVESEEFIRFSEMIQAVYISDLSYFLRTEEKNIDELGDEVDHLLSTGFLIRNGYGFGGTFQPNRKPDHTDYGKKIFNILKEADINLPY